MPDYMTHEILDEIGTLSFKYELMLANKFLYDLVLRIDIDEELEEGQVLGVSELAALSPSQCLMKLAKINGFMSGRMGFGSPNLEICQESVYDLYMIMCGWGFSYTVPSRMKANLEHLAPGKAPSLEEVNLAEYNVAYHYIASFLDYFKRAPILPTVY